MPFGKDKPFDLEDYEPKVQEAEWQRCRTAMSRYLKLRFDGRPKADKFLSMPIKPQEPLTLAFHNNHSGDLFSLPDCLEAVKNDLLSRASTLSQKRFTAFEEHSAYVSAVRQSSALRDPSTRAQVPPNDAPYTLDDLNQVLSSLNEGSRALGGCYACVMACAPGSRRLTLALMNSCLALQILATS